MNAHERAKQDEAAGDLGSAKRRLVSYVVSARFDPSICETIARLCVRMQDPTEAGRWYILCDSKDNESSDCIERFTASCGGTPGQVLSQIPQGLKLKSLDEYPPVVATRLHAMGFRGLPKQPRAETSTFKDRLATIGCLIVLAIVVGLLIVGMSTVGAWLRK